VAPEEHETIVAPIPAIAGEERRHPESAAAERLLRRCPESVPSGRVAQRLEKPVAIEADLDGVGPQSLLPEARASSTNTARNSRRV
jgi:hypothetical protein